VGLKLFLLLGAVSCAVVSALFCAFGYLAGDRRLVQMTAIAAVACAGLAFYFGSLL
jgi:hypothetical protein